MADIDCSICKRGIDRTELGGCPECGNVVQYGSSQCEKALRVKGWVVDQKNGMDICPKCVKRIKKLLEAAGK